MEAMIEVERRDGIENESVNGREEGKKKGLREEGELNKE